MKRNLCAFAVVASKVLTDTVLAIKVDNAWRPTSRAVDICTPCGVTEVKNSVFPAPAAVVLLTCLGMLDPFHDGHNLPVSTAELPWSGFAMGFQDL